MTQEDIIELWHKVWPDPGAFVRASAEDLERFAALVAAAEREACAKFADEYMLIYEGKSFGAGNAIRARGETK